MSVIERRFGMTLLVVLGLMCLVGCSSNSNPDAMYRDYLERLGNVTGFEADAATDSEAVPPYPRPRDLVLPEPELRVGLLTFWSLGECRLLQAISERNSSLGRVQAASGRLRYELTLLDRLKACEREITQSRPDDHAFLGQLAEIRKAKEANLPRTFWNASFAGPEFRNLLSTGTPPLQRNETVSLTEAELALERLARFARELNTPGTVAETAELESLLHALQTGKALGKLLQGMHLSRRELARATGILQQTARANRLCPMGRRTERGGYLFNVFVKYYAGGVQPYIGALYRSSGPVLARLRALLAAQPAEPPAAFLTFYAAWLSPDAPDALWQNFDREIKAHTQAWKAVLTQCGMLPQGPGDLQ